MDRQPNHGDRVSGLRVDRRGFFRRIGAIAVKGACGAGLLLGFETLRGGGTTPAALRGDLGLLRPPGAGTEAEFLALCIRCTRCADACEAGCIELCGPEGGILHGTPYIMPAEKGCTLCMACGEACPSQALRPLRSRQEARMGVAVVDERLCVSHNGTGVCGACHTACPLRNRAITQDFRNAPIVHADQCVGCGLCEEVCIVRDRRAIRVVTDRYVGSAGEPGAWL
jgi:ferredoxin-type protein NapG